MYKITIEDEQENKVAIFEYVMNIQSAMNMKEWLMEKGYHNVQIEEA